MAQLFSESLCQDVNPFDNRCDFITIRVSRRPQESVTSAGPLKANLGAVTTRRSRSIHCWQTPIITAS